MVSTERRPARERFDELGLAVVDGERRSTVSERVEQRSRRPLGPVLTPNVERMLEQVLSQRPHLRPDR